MEKPVFDAQAHWDANLDIANTLAARLAPVIAAADILLLEMTAHEETQLTESFAKDPSLLG